MAAHSQIYEHSLQDFEAKLLEKTNGGGEKPIDISVLPGTKENCLPALHPVCNRKEKFDIP